MSWTDKALRKHRAEKICKEIMSSKRYQDARKADNEEATTKAFDSFMVISVAYLHDRQGFGKKRLLDFIDYVVEQMHFVEEYPDYFESMNKELAKETGVDVIKMIVRD